jgi:pimeloyl-ACP methyl ester carboxylesterase
VPADIYYLAGDSYPNGEDVEAALCARLPMLHRQPDWLGADVGQLDVETRIERAASRLASCRDAVLIGRSSGARVATGIAGRHPVRAVVCLAYPFQNPDHVLQYERFGHLAHLETPTLLVQGCDDEYGGAEITERYGLSAAIQVRLVRGVRHDIRLSPAGWDRLSEMILAFLSDPPAVPDVEDFDEADYLRRYPDVAEAVREGRVASGKAHFMAQGRAEGRRYRLVPLDLDA